MGYHSRGHRAGHGLVTEQQEFLLIPKLPSTTVDCKAKYVE